jgi:hypothetical protein
MQGSAISTLALTPPCDKLPLHTLSRVHPDLDLDLNHASPPELSTTGHTLASLRNNVGRYLTNKGHLLRRYALHLTRSYCMPC